MKLTAVQKRVLLKLPTRYGFMSEMRAQTLKASEKTLRELSEIGLIRGHDYGWASANILWSLTEAGRDLVNEMTGEAVKIAERERKRAAWSNHQDIVWLGTEFSNQEGDVFALLFDLPVPISEIELEHLVEHGADKFPDGERQKRTGAP